MLPHHLQLSLQRLQQLETYLLEDPANSLLLHETLLAACQADALPQARFHQSHLSHLGIALTPIAQVEWLRLLHRHSALEEACDFTQMAHANGTLAPEAAGIASLIAVDLGNYNSASRYLALALVLTVPPLETWVAQASLALGHRDLDTARQALHMALDPHPNDGRSLSLAGFTELMAGQFMAAAQYFDQAVKTLPDHVGTWLGLGWAQLLRADWAAAAMAFNQALQRDDNVADSHAALAVLAIMRGEPEAAESALRRARKLDAHAATVIYAQALSSGAPADIEALQALAQNLQQFRLTPMTGSP